MTGSQEPARSLRDIDMSLILDALQRSQQGQSDTAVPAVPSGEHFQMANRRRGLFVGLLTGLLVSLLLWVGWVQFGAWVIRDDRERSDAQPPTSGEAPVSERSERQSISLRSGTRFDSTRLTDLTPERGDSEGAKSSAGIPPPIDELALKPAPAPELPLSTIRQLRQAEVDALYAATQSDLPKKLATESAPSAPSFAKPERIRQQEDRVIDIEEVLRRAQAEMGEAPLTPHSAPLIDRLSQQQKDRIPTLLYTEHNEVAEPPSVVINGRRLAKGDRLNGFTVVDVLVDSVVMSWGGVEFRLRALNSWVNL